MQAFLHVNTELARSNFVNFPDRVDLIRLVCVILRPRKSEKFPIFTGPQENKFQTISNLLQIRRATISPA